MSEATLKLSDRVTHLAPSGTQQVFAEAERLRRAGVDVVDLGAGEPDFATPAHVSAAAIAAIEAQFTKYTATGGIVELREAVAAAYRALYGVAYTAAEVIVTAGGKQGLFNAILAAFGPGDEVVTHAPGWPSIPEQIRLAGASPIIVRTFPEAGFRLDPERLLAAVTSRTRGFVINAPCNPTGALLAEADLEPIADFAAARGLWVVLDLCYERVVYDGPPPNLPRRLADRMRDRAVLVGSLSKTYAMTGWRCGWVLAAPEVIAACSAIQGHSTSNVSSITQKAALAALTGPQSCVDQMVQEYRERRDRLTDWLAADPRIRLVKPDGAFYLFPDVSELLSPDGIRTSAELARALLAEAHVAVTAGEAFDAPGFVRLSYATSLDRLREGAGRILAFASRQVPH